MRGVSTGRARPHRQSAPAALGAEVPPTLTQSYDPANSGPLQITLDRIIFLPHDDKIPDCSRRPKNRHSAFILRHPSHREVSEEERPGVSLLLGRVARRLAEQHRQWLDPRGRREPWHCLAGLPRPLTASRSPGRTVVDDFAFVEGGPSLGARWPGPGPAVGTRRVARPRPAPGPCAAMSSA